MNFTRQRLSSMLKIKKMTHYIYHYLIKYIYECAGKYTYFEELERRSFLFRSVLYSLPFYKLFDIVERGHYGFYS